MSRQESFPDKFALVTGGAGFLGSHVVERALKEGYHVTVIDNLYTGNLDNIAPFLATEDGHGEPRNIRFIQHDVQHPFPPQVAAGVPQPTTPGAAADAEGAAGVRMRKYDVIFHLACPASPGPYQKEPISTTLTCVNGTYHALELATQHDCPILISSTSEVYGDPLVTPQPETYWGQVNCTGIRSCYDEGKRCAESLCFDFHRHYGTRVRVARIFNTYGPRMAFNDGRVISNFLYQALTGQDITVYGTGEYTRSFQYVDDLIEGFWRLAFHPSETGPVNLGNPEEYSVKEMGEKAIALVSNTPSKLVFLPPVPDDPKQRRPDIAKAIRVLGWSPTVPVEEGLARTLAAFRAKLERERAAAAAAQ